MVDEVIFEIIIKYDYLIRQPAAATFPNREGFNGNCRVGVCPTEKY